MNTILVFAHATASFDLAKSSWQKIEDRLAALNDLETKLASIKVLLLQEKQAKEVEEAEKRKALTASA